ncbi:MAG: MerR family transcriptional regulator [Bacteriovoracaceae bacterium]|nr:MerR family transcriptional regulator [Bacteriovoracaceae bacterium]
MINSNVVVPAKAHFKMNEVCSVTGIKAYVLRFWESEFEEIAPVFAATGGKLYSKRDIDAILQIKTLLFQENLTINKAKETLRKAFVKQVENEPPVDTEDTEEIIETPLEEVGSISIDVAPNTEDFIATTPIQNMLQKLDPEKLDEIKSGLNKIISITDYLKTLC